MTEDFISAQHDLSLKTIMMKLDDASLEQYCQTNKRADAICNDESFWRSRIQMYYDSYLPLIQNKPKFLPYHVLYYIIKDIEKIVAKAGTGRKQRRERIQLITSLPDSVYRKISKLPNSIENSLYIKQIFSNRGFNDAFVIPLARLFSSDGNDKLTDYLIERKEISETDSIGYMSNERMRQYAKRWYEKYQEDLKRRSNAGLPEDEDEDEIEDGEDEETVFSPIYHFRNKGAEWSDEKAYIFLTEARCNHMASLAHCILHGLYKAAYEFYKQIALGSNLATIYSEIIVYDDGIEEENLCDHFVQFCLFYNLPINYDILTSIEHPREMSLTTVVALSYKGIYPNRAYAEYYVGSTRRYVVDMYKRHLSEKRN